MERVDIVVVLRHLGAEREILVLKANRQNFYAFPPYAKKPIGSFDVHMSLHSGGERHFAVKLNGQQGMEGERIQEESIVNFCPPSALDGVIQLYQSGIFLNQFHCGLPVGTNEGQVVTLDATAGGWPNFSHAARFSAL
ncbi:MAG TPA: hypothetical protein VN976_03245 [Verrucomicrobiae bacterium]|nr:hypothetical protein [Verrucomicrobiae bacterium]